LTDQRSYVNHLSTILVAIFCVLCLCIGYSLGFALGFALGFQFFFFPGDT
jgi:hypothetical protein